jgi:hypothetical protein
VSIDKAYFLAYIYIMILKTITKAKANISI